MSRPAAAPWIDRLLAAERDRLGLWLPVFFGAGIAVYFALTIEPDIRAGPLCALAAALAWWVARSDLGKALSLTVLIAGLGFSAAAWRTHSLDAPILERRLGPVTVSGIVDEIAPESAGGELILRSLTVPRLSPAETPRRLRLSTRSPIDLLTVGDRVEALAVLRPPPPPIMPGAFDFQRRAYFLELGAYGFVLGDVKKTGQEPATAMDATGRWIAALRLDIVGDVRRAAPTQAAAVAAALLTGHRGYIDETTLRNMRDAGIAHLLAISGLHIGLIAGLVYAGMRLAIAAIPWLGLRIDGKKVAAALAIPAAAFYAVLAGLTVPTERALIMTALMLTGVLIDRRVLSLRTVALAALIVLAMRPESLIGPGFQMSFAAVTALIAVHVWLRDRRRDSGAERKRGPVAGTCRYIGGVLITTLVASAATAPFAIYHFQHAATLGLVANLIAMPLAAFWVMPAGLVALLAMPFGLADWPVAAMIAGTDLILRTAAWVSGLPLAAADIAAPPAWSLPAVALGGLWLALWRSRLRLAGVPLLIAGLMGPALARPPDLLVDGDARLAGIATKDGRIMVSNLRAGRFEADGWRRRAGTPGRDPPWPNDPEHPAGNLRCDENGCTLGRDGWTVAISMNPATLDDDCRLSDIVIALIPVGRSCRPPKGVIDRFDLWRGGTHAVYLSRDGPRVQSVNGERGRRPWVAWRGDQYAR